MRKICLIFYLALNDIRHIIIIVHKSHTNQRQAQRPQIKGPSATHNIFCVEKGSHIAIYKNGGATLLIAN